MRILERNVAAQLMGKIKDDVDFIHKGLGKRKMSFSRTREQGLLSLFSFWIPDNWLCQFPERRGCCNFTGDGDVAISRTGGVAISGTTRVL